MHASKSCAALGVWSFTEVHAAAADGGRRLRLQGWVAPGGQIWPALFELALLGCLYKLSVPFVGVLVI